MFLPKEDGPEPTNRASASPEVVSLEAFAFMRFRRLISPWSLKALEGGRCSEG